jgi:DNA replication protein DnaC
MRSESLDILLRELNLRAFANQSASMAEQAEREGWSFLQYLHHLAEHELGERQIRRIDRLRKESNLPDTKTMATLDRSKLTDVVSRQLAGLCEGRFVEKAQNILAFGLPGRGKSHVLCAIGHALVERGHPVLFVPAFKLVQQLLVAKQGLRLDKELKKLDRFEAVIIDDIGYIQQGRDEMEVLFTFLAERYERKSVLISSNLVFSQWDRIFKDPMTTAAAIDRLVHHSTILEMSGSSYRTEKAKENSRGNKATDDNYLAPVEMNEQGV